MIRPTGLAQPLRQSNATPRMLLLLRNRCRNKDSRHPVRPPCWTLYCVVCQANIRVTQAPVHACNPSTGLLTAFPPRKDWWLNCGDSVEGLLSLEKALITGNRGSGGSVCSMFWRPPNHGEGHAAGRDGWF